MAIDAERLNLIFALAIAGSHSRHNYAAIFHCILYPIRIHFHVIKTFRDAGLDCFYCTGSKAGIQPKHDKKLRTQLTALDAAAQLQDLAVIPGWRLHELKGGQAGRWSITVNGNWRLTFSFEGTDVVLLDYQDYY
jgi:proteic killer suppression protein